MKTILVAIDFSDISSKLIDTALVLARALGSKLHLVHVVQPSNATAGLTAGPEIGIVPSTAGPDDPEHVEKRLAELKKRSETDGVEVVTRHLRGSVVEKLVEELKETKADLAIVGSHGHGAVYHLVVGSIAEGLLKKSPCPILVIPTRQR